ncbi:MAG: fatty acid desaturase [Deltaproteobacteria bacterium]|nr:fatty acid desaturase [Deltaproteobacteria bacterium]
MNVQVPQRSVLPADFDAARFLAEVDAIRAELDAGRGEADARHLRQVEWVAAGASIAGWALAFGGWWAVGALGIALGRFVRWTCVAHHVLHRGYDAVPGLPPHRQSRGFARGWRRLLDWPDWMFPAAWIREHNQLHHYRLGELADPDLVEENARFLQPRWLPVPARLVLVMIVIAGWRWLYFAPTAIRAWQESEAGQLEPSPRPERTGPRMLLPWGRSAAVWTRSYLPFGALAFVALPALGLLFGPDAALSGLLASLLGELIANVHSYAVIVPNHAGDDLWRFDQRVRGRAELLLRQIVGSVDFATGGFWRDLMHGYLNYQIEHHVWPDLSMLQLAKSQPKLRALCAEMGIPYAQESVWRRNVRLMRLMLGVATMRRADRALSVPESEAIAADPSRPAAASAAAPDRRAAAAG